MRGVLVLGPVTDAVINAALGALSTWVEWTPMARITASNALDACAFFLSTPDFRLAALDVLKSVSPRAHALLSLHPTT